MWPDGPHRCSGRHAGREALDLRNRTAPTKSKQATNQGTSVVATKSNHDRCFRFYSPAPFVESIDRAIALKTDPVRRERLASLKGTNVYAARWLVANAQNEKAGAVAPVTKPATTSDLGHEA